MKYRYFILFCTIMILSISTVSAADNTTENIQIDDTTGDLTDLQTLIDEDTRGYVNLTGNYVGDANNKTVVINKNITIDGKGHTLEYFGNNTLIDVQSGNTLLKNMTIIRYSKSATININGGLFENVNFIFKGNTTIFANNLTKNYKNSSQFYATIVDANNQTLANTTVTFYVNGVYYNRTTDSNGRAKLNINLSPGTYIITSTNTVTNETRQNIIEVRFGTTTIMAYNLYKFCKDDSKPFYARALDYDGNPLANVTITFKVNNVIYNRTTDSDGRAKLNINLNPGKYIITSTNTVTNETKQNIIGVRFGNSIIADNLYKFCKDDSKPFYALALDYDGIPLPNVTITFYVNGVYYNRTTDSDVGAKLNINLNPGNYTITSENTVTREVITNMIIVLPNIVENNDLEKYFRNNSQYVVKILNGDGTPAKANETVTFNINGVFYNRTTNETGHAKLNINLNPGEYIITAEYKGCKVSNKIKVKSILSAEDLTKKYGTPDQFKAKLVDGEGNPLANTNVTFNINGVFYNRTTDSDGIAKLNIRLMPGEYIITSSYNECYISNKITVTA